MRPADPEELDPNGKVAPLLAFDALSIVYADRTVVRDLSLRIRRGETAALVGESGSGKSQSAFAALRILPPEARVSGRILFEGQDLLTLSGQKLNALRGKRIALIFQEPMSALDPLYPVGEQVSAVLRHHLELSRKAAFERACDLLHEVGIREPKQKAHAYPHELSGGQRQRVAIAMAISCEPSLLIADEPTTALDVALASRILDLIAELKQRHGMALLFISHDLGLVSRVADRVHVMHSGEIVESGAAKAILHEPHHAYTKLLIEAALPPRDARGQQRPQAGEPSILIEARDLTVHFPQRGASPFPFFSRLAGLAFPRREKAAQSSAATILDHVSLALRTGETFGLIGESGSGKSTFARALMRLVPATGTIIFDGRDLLDLDARAMRPLRRDMQMVFQDPYQALSPRMRIGAIVTEGLRIHEPGLDKKALDIRAAKALEEVKLDPLMRHRFPHECSGGQRQRIAIARAMILRPKLLLLDEPTSALDRSIQTDILALLKELQEHFSLTYLFISHDFSAIRAIAHRIGVMQAGRLIETGPAETLFTHPQADYTKSLIAAAFPRTP
ncbi:ABC transporter ATP-binding protein [Beijerinckia mobilis]|uniref:ABC transporter ATP-binding protein n=1 Tax=Beijerinckia mobilis TaxID=231434 RepID=UPI00068ADC0C|nr:dipeptide ABC transporter ATP-binding protein [Beijerinckia mobilis]